MEMKSIYDAIGIETWNAADISAPFYIWPLSESSVRYADTIGLLHHSRFRGFIDSYRDSFSVDSTTFEAVKPTPDIEDTIYVLSSLHSDDIHQAIRECTRSRESYLLRQNDFFTHVRDQGDAGEDRRSAMFSSAHRKVVELLPKDGWPDGSDTFKKRLRDGMEDITAQQVDELLDFVAGEKFDVVYFSVPAYFEFVRESAYLRRKNFRTLFVTISEDFARGKKPYFDAVVQTDGNYFLAMVYALLARCDIFHIRGWMTHYMTAATLAAVSTRKTVVEFLDIPEFLCDRETYAHLYDGDMAHDDFESFPVIFDKADGLVLNHHEDGIEKLKNKYNATANTLQYHSYVCDEFCAREDVSLGKPYSIVYAGTLIPSSYPHAYLGVCQLLPLIQKLTRQGLGFTVYGNPFIKFREQYWDYLFESRRNQLLSIVDGGPPDEVTWRMAGHHFGLLMYIFDGVDVGRYHFMNLPTKLTLYLEAGLPLLVSDKLEYVAAVVRKNGIGLVVPQRDIDAISDIIADCDYRTMRQNVLNFRRRFNAEAMIGGLTDFYQRI